MTMTSGLGGSMSMASGVLSIVATTGGVEFDGSTVLTGGLDPFLDLRPLLRLVRRL